MRGMMIAAVLAMGLAACNPNAGQPPLPKTEPGAMNAPTVQQAASAEGQASLTPEQRQQLEQLVRGFLDHAQGQLGQGMVPAAGFNDHVAALQPGRDDRWQVDLIGGKSYRIIGACDNECSNLDIELIDTRGGVVASDLAPDDFPVVNFTPSANGRYIVRLLMQTCTVAPCYTGARVLTSTGG